MAMRVHAKRSLSGATGIGAGLGCAEPGATRTNYIEGASQTVALVAAGPVATVVVEALMPGDNPPSVWVQVGSMAVTASVGGFLQLFGPFLDLRLNCTVYSSGNVTGDIMWQEEEWY